MFPETSIMNETPLKQGTLHRWIFEAKVFLKSTALLLMHFNY